MKCATFSLAVAMAAVSVQASPTLIPQPRRLVAREGTFSCSGDIAKQVKFEKDATIPKEGYRLTVAPDGIKVASSDDAGSFYALQTLKQLAVQDKKTVKVACVEIEDSPRYPWRGVLLDECRHFFGKETVKSVLDLMAEYKLNRFHWHLTEDQGWRLDVPGYPELVKYGAVRSSSVVHGKKAHRGTKEDADKLNGVKYGPYYYTEADIKEIVAYAAERHIQIVPEIELPGHVYAALASYPQFACNPKNVWYAI